MNKASFYFRLQTDRSRSSTELSTRLAYTPLRWVHLLATYDGQTLKLFKDGSQVTVSNSTQRGSLFSERSATSCKFLVLGGDDRSEKYFRGMVDDVKLWRRALTRTEVRDVLNLNGSSDPVIHETFNNLESWEMLKGLAPEIVDSDLDPDRHDLGAMAPPCGVTICDDPDVVRSYATHEQLRPARVVRYRVINVMLDDGTLPTVNESQIALQHAALNEAFGPYNISWERQEVNITNSSLRLKAVILGCDSDKVGNGRCNEECRHERTGNDGGDCDAQRVRIIEPLEV